MKAELPPNEDARLAALDEYDILDTPTEAEFDAVTELASRLCETPISVVNLIARGRQWFKSEVGLGVRETPLETSICAHAILEEEFLMVPDTRVDRRFADNELVTGEPFLRFYAGALLRSPEGFPLGTLCVLDTKPRQLDAQQVAALRTLGLHVMTMLNLRRSNRELQATGERLQSVLAGRQRLVASIAHDLRTPLSVIQLGATTLASAPLSKVSRRTLSTRLRQASESMNDLVQDLLDHESQEGGALSVERKPMAVGTAITDVIELMHPLAEQAQVRLNYSAQGPVWVDADGRRLHQVLTNLVGNALKFTPPGGEVRLELRPLPGAVEIAVSDTGPGIPREEHESIFDPYVRADRGDSYGAGLGLAIVRRIIEAHEGEVGVHSELGHGSRFYARLPTCAPPHAQAEPAAT